MEGFQVADSCSVWDSGLFLHMPFIILLVTSTCYNWLCGGLVCDWMSIDKIDSEWNCFWLKLSLKWCDLCLSYKIKLIVKLRYNFFDLKQKWPSAASTYNQLWTQSIPQHGTKHVKSYTESNVKPNMHLLLVFVWDFSLFHLFNVKRMMAGLHWSWSFWIWSSISWKTFRSERCLLEIFKATYYTWYSTRFIVSNFITC